MNYGRNIKVYAQQTTNTERNLNPNVISVPQGYQIEVFATGLDTPIGIAFMGNGDMLIADAGVATGNPKVLRLVNGQFQIIADGFNVPITGINVWRDAIYVSHRGVITVINPDGSRRDIISGLPSYGDHSNNRVEFGQDGKMYFGQGTATNSGVVGLDNEWIFEHPYFHDSPGSYITVIGTNFATSNVLIPAANMAYTGAFSPFGVPNIQEVELLRGNFKASGSILRANPDGSDLELVAWGFRNPFQMLFDQFNRLIIANQGFDNRGSRPIANAPDELHVLSPGAWYGWPDYAAGEAITLPRFTDEGRRPNEMIFSNIPSTPPRPIAAFPSGSTIMGFDFNLDARYGTVGDVFIAMFGEIRYESTGEIVYSGVGHRVSRVNMITGGLSTFAINRSGFPQADGLSRPTDVKFGPDGVMYITDFSSIDFLVPNIYIPSTGVIWRIIRT